MTRRVIASTFVSAVLIAVAAVAPGTARAATICASGTGATLNVTAAAKVSTGGHGTLGLAQARQLAATLHAAAGDICTTSASAAVKAKLAAIATLYKTNAAAAHTQLVAFLAGVASGTIHGTLRTTASARHASSLCPTISPTIHVNGAGKTSADLAAAATAQAAGDSAGVDAANAAATSDFENWADSANPTSVGDWITILQGAQALGDGKLEQSALDGAKSAAEKAVKAAEPKGDPCKASPEAKSCLIQANAVAQMLGATGTAGLEKLLDCGETWTFAMTLAGSSSGGAFGTFVYDTGTFLVNRAAKTITDDGGPWNGHISGTYSCVMNGHTVESGSVPPSAFHYTITGKVTPTGFQITAGSPDVNVPNPFHTKICKGMGGLGLMIMNEFVKHGLPLPFKVAPDGTSAVFSANEGGSIFHATITKVS